MASERPFGPEGPECEWKLRPPRPERLARTLAAFHNGAGGSVWIGVADDGTRVGVSDLAPTRAAVEAAGGAACTAPAPDDARPWLFVALDDPAAPRGESLPSGATISCRGDRAPSLPLLPPDPSPRAGASVEN